MEKQSSSMPSIRPASDLQTKFAEVMQEIYQTDKPTFLTKEGYCDTVIMSADTFSKYELTKKALSKELVAALEKKETDEYPCSFCGKLPSEVQQMIGGPKVNICDSCIDLCNEVLEAKVTDDTKV